ncbi:phage tail protein I [Shewanella xiamenensis]|uniref:phage tail protein I n=1 Tax=Shewanella xiamenensis TaxID=332186 RepID=UPI002E7B5810|nr:phage tail protein I [Shewanella xiamenensis]
MSQSTLPSALKTYSVLPDNRSALERGLELALSEELYAVPQPYPQLLDARYTQPNMLPYLAAERQLPVWDSADPEYIKRNLTGNAWQVRRLSGTRAGLKMALESLDFLSEITPWYQQVPQAAPYNLAVLAWEKGNKPVNVANVHRLLAYINDSKSERDVIELSLMFGVETQLGLAGAIAPATNVTESNCTAGLWPMPNATVSLAIGGGALPGINIKPLSLLAITPVVSGYAQLGITTVAGHYSITVSAVNANAVI